MRQNQARKTISAHSANQLFSYKSHAWPKMTKEKTHASPPYNKIGNRISSRRNSISHNRSASRIILIIIKTVGDALGDIVLLHVTSIAEEEHLIHLLLIFNLQLILLSGEPCSKFLHFLLQMFNLLISLLALGCSNLHLLSQPTDFSLSRLLFLLGLPQRFSSIRGNFLGVN